VKSVSLRSGSAVPAESGAEKPRQAEQFVTPSGARRSFNVRNGALTVIAFAVAIALLQYMQAVLIPFVLSALMFYALDPFVDRMQRRKIPRSIGAMVMLALVVASLGGIGYFLQDQALHMVEQLPQAVQRLRRETVQARQGPTVIDKVQAAANEIEKTAAQAPATPPPSPGVTRVRVEPAPFDAAGFFWSGSISVLSMINSGIIIVLLTYFMLLSDDLFKRKVVEVVGTTLSEKKITVQMLDEIAVQIERFLLIQVITSVVVAVATGLALWTMGLEDAAFWGFVAGVLNSIPYYGPLLVTAGLGTAAFLQFGTLPMTAAIAGVALFITALEGWVLTPALVGSAAQMNKVAVFAGLLFWSWMWQIPGTLLAIPIMMIVKVVCDRVEGLQPIGHFLGE
jgi:predicted PurR-regulated permease PerM